MLRMINIIFAICVFFIEGSAAASLNSNYFSHAKIGASNSLGNYGFYAINEEKINMTANLFVPIWQQTTDIVFADMRIMSDINDGYEFSAPLGYRHFYEDKNHIYGAYISFDKRKTNIGNTFNQVSFGAEFWFDKIFIGGNIYKPVGDTYKAGQDLIASEVINEMPIFVKNEIEEAVPGIDFRLGYAIFNNITAYIGGYYFNAMNNDLNYGSLAELTYDVYFNKNINTMTDKLSIGIGLKQDRLIRTSSLFINISFMPSFEDRQDKMIENLKRSVDHVVSVKGGIVTSRENTEVTPIENRHTPKEGFYSIPSEDTNSSFEKNAQEIPIVCRYQWTCTLFSAIAEKYGLFSFRNR